VLLFPSVALAQHESNASGDEPWAIRIARVQQQQTTGAQPQQTTGAEQKGKLPGDEKVEAAVEEAVRRFRIGVEAGVGLDPEIIMFGVHGRFGPYFTRDVVFRPGIEFGIGEVTTIFGVNLEGIFTFSRAGSPEWVPYIGGGPNFALSHQSFEAPPPEEGEEAPPEEDDSRFDFSDTDFKAGFNFIAGARKENGMFFEMKATAWGVSNIRLLAGFNF
jgi:hypothetical protein